MNSKSDLSARGMGVLLKKGDGPYTRAEMCEAWISGIISSFNGMHTAALMDPYISDAVRKEYLRCIDEARNAIIEAARTLTAQK